MLDDSEGWTGPCGEELDAVHKSPCCQVLLRHRMALPSAQIYALRGVSPGPT
jgi:hypothetical protein